MLFLLVISFEGYPFFGVPAEAPGRHDIHMAFSLLILLAQSVRFELTPGEKLDEWIDRAPKKNEERLAALRTLFTEAGCAEHLTETKVKGSKLPNLICRLPGATPEMIVVGAHYDKVKAGEGLIDNWTGAVALAAVYRTLAQAPERPRRTILFVGFTDEEKGLVGSTYFARQIPKEQLPQYAAMVNVDSLGAGPTRVWSAHADRGLLTTAARVAANVKAPLEGIDLDQVGDGDSSPFRTRGIRVIDFHSLTQENFRILHTDRDTRAAFRKDDYWESYRLLTAFVGFLASLWSPPATP